ncbi:hypothetical protein [Roseivivax sp. CAU 1761]
MNLWVLMEYAAWAASAGFAAFIILDWIKTDSTYSDDVLMSSREGELESMTEEHEL